MRASHCTNIPKKKAMATDTKMAMITESALSVLIRSPNARVASLFTLIRERAKVPPSSSKTSETVVEVGMPMELKTSRRTTSVSMTASSIHMISAK